MNESSLRVPRRIEKKIVKSVATNGSIARPHHVSFVLDFTDDEFGLGDMILSSGVDLTESQGMVVLVAERRRSGADHGLAIYRATSRHELIRSLIEATDEFQLEQYPKVIVRRIIITSKLKRRIDKRLGKGVRSRDY